MVELRKISILDDNIRECIELDVTPEQRGFVAHNATSLGHAYSWNARYNEDGGYAVPYAIYADGAMVGFVMYGYIKQVHDDTYGEDCYFFWRFMLDKSQQSKGYGRQAMTQILDEIRQMPYGKADYCYTSYEPENAVAKRLYESFGFVETGQVDDGENIARLKL